MNPKIKYKCSIYFFIIYAIAFASSAHAQGKFRLKQPAIYYGFTTGNGFDNERYALLMIIFNIPFDLGIEKHRFIQTQLIFEPQYNRVQTVGKGKLSDFEYGLNTGFRLLHKTRFLDTYFQVSTGPHYISADFRNGESNLMQRGSFIFANNLVWGFRKRVGPINIHAETRFRHISNANLKEPNGGVNSLIIVFGIGKRF